MEFLETWEEIDRDPQGLNAELEREVSLGQQLFGFKAIDKRCARAYVRIA